jgi:all-trans-retinol dehydrogenase (NAD+)
MTARGSGLQRGAEIRAQAQRPGVKTTVICPFSIDTGMFHGVKTRFPLLLPILKEADVVERIVRAIQHDTPQVLLPRTVSTLPAIRLLPAWAFDRAADPFGLTVAMDEFTGRAAAEKT